MYHFVSDSDYEKLLPETILERCQRQISESESFRGYTKKLALCKVQISIETIKKYDKALCRCIFKHNPNFSWQNSNFSCKIHTLLTRVCLDGMYILFTKMVEIRK